MSSYTPQTISNYNDSPAPDDGTEVADNEITWQKIKEELTDPLKTGIEAVDSAAATAINTDGVGDAQYVVKTANETYTNDTTLSDIDDLVFTNLDTGGKYLIEGYIGVLFGGGNAKFDFSVTGATILGVSFDFIDSSKNISGDHLSLTNSAVSTGMASATGSAHFRGAFTTSSGTNEVQLRGAQSVSNADPLIVGINSWIRVVRLS